MTAIDFDGRGSGYADHGCQIVMYTKYSRAVEGLVDRIATLRHHPVFPKKQVRSIDRRLPLRKIVPREGALEANTGFAKDGADVPKGGEVGVRRSGVRPEILCRRVRPRPACDRILLGLLPGDTVLRAGMQNPESRAQKDNGARKHGALAQGG